MLSIMILIKKKHSVQGMKMWPARWKNNLVLFFGENVSKEEQNKIVESFSIALCIIAESLGTPYLVTTATRIYNIKCWISSYLRFKAGSLLT